MMELSMFPFDFQDLPLRFRTRVEADKIELIPVEHYQQSTPLEPSGLPNGSVPPSRWVQQGWKNLGTRSSEVISRAEASSSGREYPIWQINTQVARNSGYYISNMYFPLFLVVWLAFAAFAIPPTDLADRLTVVLTLLLTAVAFKYIVAQSLPMISYLTMVDTYIVWSLLVLSVVALESVAVSRKFTLSQADEADKFDEHWCYALIAVWAAVHLYQLVIAFFYMRQMTHRTRHQQMFYTAPHKKR
eukprot:TRINITY_DN1428_c0_g1_i8.p1 TRINITY_DN1428_c0_g1~~TRINITY_DN1428_c0_g1_i8.p1  ORF type:complete len:245 (+),score=41.47 TRINITY_DN1428_c0_g1_i8:509-1243(+)